jgi:hypothetical protein
VKDDARFAGYTAGFVDVKVHVGPPSLTRSMTPQLCWSLPVLSASRSVKLSRAVISLPDLGSRVAIRMIHCFSALTS